MLLLMVEIILERFKLPLQDWKEAFLDIMKIGNTVTRRIVTQMDGLPQLLFTEKEILHINGYQEVED